MLVRENKTVFLKMSHKIASILRRGEQVCSVLLNDNDLSF